MNQVSVVRYQQYQGTNQCGASFLPAGAISVDRPAHTAFCLTGKQWALFSSLFLPDLPPAAALTAFWKVHLSLNGLMVIENCNRLPAVQVSTERPTKVHQSTLTAETAERRSPSVEQ